MSTYGCYLNDNRYMEFSIWDSVTSTLVSGVNNFWHTQLGGSGTRHSIYPLKSETCITEGVGYPQYARKCIYIHDSSTTQLFGIFTIYSDNPIESNYDELTKDELDSILGNWVVEGLATGIFRHYGTESPVLRCTFAIDPNNDQIAVFYSRYNDDNYVYVGNVIKPAYGTTLCGYTDSVFYDYEEGTKYGLITDRIPNEEGGISETGGGDGAFEISSDIIEQFDVSKLISAINTGFMRAYAIKPNEMQLIRDLATYMWTSDFVDNLKKLWGDPMQVIMGLSAIPVTPARGGVQNVVLGNVQSPVAMPPATSQYVVHNCGSITIKKYWGNYLDYKYTKASIYLPFIGGQELDIQKVMGKTLSLAYIIDIVSGACSAQLVADGSVIGNWQGSCAMGLPISAENFSRYYVGALTSAGAGLIKGSSAGPIGALAGAITGAAVNSAINPPHVEMNGNVSGAGGYMSCRRPYIQLTLPRQSLAEIYNEIEGYPCNITYTLGELTGYTVVQNVHLENIIATADELEEIEELLKSGVIF